MKLALLLTGVVACTGSDLDDYPVGGGTGGGGGTGSGSGARDAAIDASDAMLSTLIGRVCLMTDLRTPFQLSKCSLTDAGGITVKLGTLTTLTNTDGTFAIALQPGADTWTATGPAAKPIFPTIIKLGAGPHIIPAIDADTYGALSAGNGVPLVADQGALVVLTVRNNSALAGVTATLTPAVNEIFYDGVSADIWNSNNTSANGVVWFPGVPVPVAPSALEALRTTPQHLLQPSTISVTAQALTFVTVQIPL